MTCNVQTTDVDLGLVTLIEGGFSQYDDELLKVIQFAERQEDSVQLVKSDEPNRISAFWFTEQERLGDGFSASFSFTATDGTSDGFAFVVQDIRTFDTVSSAGTALGFSDAFDSYLGVGFDFCSDRNLCSLQEVRVETKLPGEAAVATRSTPESNLFGNSGGDATVNVRIDYLEDDNVVEIFINGDSVLAASGVVLADLLTQDGKFAFFGFTASNAESAAISTLVPLELRIENLDIVQFNSGFRMRPEDLVPKIIDFGQVVTLGFLVVDSCNEPNSNAPEISQSDVSAFLTEASTGERLEFQNFQQNGPEIFLTFPTLANVVTTYELEIKVDGVLVQQNPLPDIVVAEVPEQGGLSALGIGLLIALIAILAIAIVFIARGWYKYRSKLVEYAEDIEIGKVKEELDGIDKEVEYVMNPMVAPLDKLKERLAINEKRIKDLKASQQEAIDSDYTVEQLQEENKELRAEMAELKKQQEYENAGNRQSTAFEKRVFDKTQPKTDFDQDRV